MCRGDLASQPKKPKLVRTLIHGLERRMSCHFVQFATGNSLPPPLLHILLQVAPFSPLTLLVSAVQMWITHNLLLPLQDTIPKLLSPRCSAVSAPRQRWKENCEHCAICCKHTLPRYLMHLSSCCHLGGKRLLCREHKLTGCRTQVRPLLYALLTSSVPLSTFQVILAL